MVSYSCSFLCRRWATQQHAQTTVQDTMVTSTAVHKGEMIRRTSPQRLQCIVFITKKVQLVYCLMSHHLLLWMQMLLWSFSGRGGGWRFFFVLPVHDVGSCRYNQDPIRRQDTLEEKQKEDMFLTEAEVFQVFSQNTITVDQISYQLEPVCVSVCYVHFDAPAECSY